MRCHAAPAGSAAALIARMQRRYLQKYTSLGGLSAEVGAGMLIGQLYWAAWQDGQKAFPAGVGTNVGLGGGHRLGGLEHTATKHMLHRPAIAHTLADLSTLRPDVHCMMLRHATQPVTFFYAGL